MRAPQLLLPLVLLLAGAPEAGAQVGAEVVGKGNQVGTSVPEDQVAALIREALRAPDDRGTWAGLAQGLSNIPIRDREGLVGMRAAVRIADSLAFAPDLGASGATVTNEAGSWWKSLSSIVSGPLGWAAPTGFPAGQRLFLPISLSLVLVGWMLIRRGRMSRRVVAGPLAFFGLVRRVSRVARGTTPRKEAPSGGKRDPRAMAISLMETGMPANEVARRTGMSQDEVSVLLALQGSGRGVGMAAQASRSGRI